MSLNTELPKKFQQYCTLFNEFINRIQRSELLLDNDAACLEYHFIKSQNNCRNYTKRKNIFNNTLKCSTVALAITSGIASTVCSNRKFTLTLCALSCIPILHDVYSKRKLQKYSDKFNLLLSQLNMLMKQNRLSLKYLQRALNITDYYHKNPKMSSRSSLLSAYIDYKNVFSLKLKLIVSELLKFMENMLTKVSLIVLICDCTELRDCLNRMEETSDFENIKHVIDLYTLVTSNFLTVIGLCLMPNTWTTNSKRIQHVEYLLDNVIYEAVEMLGRNVPDIENGYLNLQSSLEISETDNDVMKKNAIQNQLLSPIYNSVQDAAINFQLSFFKAVYLLKEIGRIPDTETDILVLGQLLDELGEQHSNTAVSLEAAHKYYRKSVNLQTTKICSNPTDNEKDASEEWQLSNTYSAKYDDPAFEMEGDQEFNLFISSTDDDDCKMEEDWYEEPKDLQAQIETKALMTELSSCLAKRNRVSIPLEGCHFDDVNSAGISTSKEISPTASGSGTQDLPSPDYAAGTSYSLSSPRQLKGKTPLSNEQTTSTEYFAPKKYYSHITIQRDSPDSDSTLSLESSDLTDMEEMPAGISAMHKDNSEFGEACALMGENTKKFVGAGKENVEPTSILISMPSRKRAHPKKSVRFDLPPKKRWIQSTVENVVHLPELFVELNRRPVNPNEEVFEYGGDTERSDSNARDYKCQQLKNMRSFSKYPDLESNPITVNTDTPASPEPELVPDEVPRLIPNEPMEVHDIDHAENGHGPANGMMDADDDEVVANGHIAEQHGPRNGVQNGHAM